MSTPGPWRVGGQAFFDGQDFKELPSGMDIWSAEGPVTEFADIFDEEDVELMAQAPTLRARVAELDAQLATARAEERERCAREAWIAVGDVFGGRSSIADADEVAARVHSEKAAVRR